jgi:hypothetical protein
MDADTLAMLILLPVVGLMMLTLAVGGALVVRDTVRRRGRWGINLSPVHCPRCGERAPVVRVPKNRRQTLWGGCTCAGCGLEYDKWGRPVEGDPHIDTQLDWPEGDAPHIDTDLER